MTSIGIVEGFFGPEWSAQARSDFSSFLQKYGGDFYIYAPKRDPHLRKAWRETWEHDWLIGIRKLAQHFQSRNIKFGVGFSPFGLGDKITAEDWTCLKDKLQILSDLDLDYLGLFFDDMPSTNSLLQNQREVVELALNFFPSGLIFCPSYYTFDPILDKVFGQRPEGYMQGLSTQIPTGVDVCWTGPKVISETIGEQHLLEVETLLGRKPFIWENLYANDGPRNCKFLKLRYFEGRDESLANLTSGVGFNLMNQPYLSQLVYLSSLWQMQKKLSPEVAFENALNEFCPPELAALLIKHRSLLLEVGLDKMSEDQKASLLAEFVSIKHPVAQDIQDWLKGVYLVGPECLTD